MRLQSFFESERVTLPSISSLCLLVQLPRKSEEPGLLCFLSTLKDPLVTKSFTLQVHNTISKFIHRIQTCSISGAGASGGWLVSNRIVMSFRRGQTDSIITNLNQSPG